MKKQTTKQTNKQTNKQKTKKQKKQTKKKTKEKKKHHMVYICHISENIVFRLLIMNPDFTLKYYNRSKGNALGKSITVFILENKM